VAIRFVSVVCDFATSIQSEQQPRASGIYHEQLKDFMKAEVEELITLRTPLQAAFKEKRKGASE
jgi:hypothetical protein